MSKKHFEYLANEIKILEDREAARIAANVVISAGNEFNPNFNKARFLKACDL